MEDLTEKVQLSYQALLVQNFNNGQVEAGNINKTGKKEEG